MKSQFKIGSLLSYLFTLLSILIALILTPIEIKFLGQSEYGLFILIGSFITYFSIFDFGLSTSVYRFVSKYQADNNHKEQANFLAIILRIYLFIIFLLVSLGILIYFNFEYIFQFSLNSQEIVLGKNMFAILLVNLLFSLPLNSFQYVVKAYGRFIFVYITSIIKLILRSILIISILLYGSGALGVVIIDTIFNILVGIIFVLYSFLRLKIKFKLNQDNKKSFYSIISFSFFVFLQMIVNQVFWKTGQIFLGVYTNSVNVAIFSLSITIITYFQSFSMSISGLLMPKVTKLVHGKIDRYDLTLFLSKFGRLQVMFIGFLVVGFLVLGKDFIYLWLGPDFSEVYTYTVIILIPYFISLVQSSTNTVAQAENKYGFISLFYLLMTFFNLVLSFYSYQIYGLVGISISMGVLLFLFTVVIINIFYVKVLKINVFLFFKESFKNIWFVLLITGLSGFFFNKLMHLEGIFGFLINGIAISLIYLTLIYLIGLNATERSTFYSLLYKFKILLKLGKK
jgi:O-antigen/teichoic acid export membrane protein